MAKTRTVSKEMPDTPAADEPKIVRAKNAMRRTEKSPEFVTLYANDMQIQMTPWDVRLILGQIAGIPTVEDPTLLVRQVGELRMSPQLTKRLVGILIAQIKHYERTVGPIPLPEED